MCFELHGDGSEAQSLSPKCARVRSDSAHVMYSSREVGLRASLAGFQVEVLRFAQGKSSRLACPQRGFGPSADQLGFSLGNGGHDVDGQVIGFGHVDGDEPYAGFHEGSDDGDVAGEAVELGDQKHAADSFRLFQSGFELRTSTLPSPSLDFSELRAQTQSLASGVNQHRSFLSF